MEKDKHAKQENLKGDREGLTRKAARDQGTHEEDKKPDVMHQIESDLDRMIPGDKTDPNARQV